MSGFDVIVVGGGAMGMHCTAALARRGKRVLCLDRYGVPNAEGSSHGETRAIRLAYFEHPDYVPLLRRAYTLWSTLEEEVGERLLHRTGAFYAGPPDSEVLSGSLHAAAIHKIPIESLSPEEVRTRFPQFQLPESFGAAFEPDGGVLLPERAISAAARISLRWGAQIRGFEPVLDWATTPSGVRVTTEVGAYEADHLVLCAGAWTSRLLAQMGTALRVTRQVAAWVWPSDPTPYALGTLPFWGIQEPSGTFFYGFPMMDGRPGLKLACHQPGPTIDADAKQPITLADADVLREVLRTYFHGADGPVLNLSTCLYTNTPDGHFVIDRWSDRVAFACGFSGHGFKFAPVVGEALADLVEGTTELPIGFLGRNRLTGVSGPAASPAGDQASPN